MDRTPPYRRGDVLRTVIEVANTRCDGLLPTDVEGVRETFADDLDLLAALQLRWVTRLSGRIERELHEQPMDLEAAVVRAWQAIAVELPGVRALVDHARENPLDDATATAMERATAKERTLLAVMAGQASPADASAPVAGAAIEGRARRSLVVPAPGKRRGAPKSLVGRLMAAIAA